MVLKSYRLKKKGNSPKSTSMKKRKAFPDFVTPAVTALIGVALVSETATALRSL